MRRAFHPSTWLALLALAAAPLAASAQVRAPAPAPSRIPATPAPASALDNALTAPDPAPSDTQTAAPLPEDQPAATLPDITAPTTTGELDSSAPPPGGETTATDVTTAGAAAPGGPTMSPVISSDQIDRYQAIQTLRQSLMANPNNLADWIILGELAQEMAVQVPADKAGGYFRLARDAYQGALRLDPDNPGLKAAVAFVRAQEQGTAEFNQTRQQATSAYIEARRREIAADGARPMVRTYTPVLPTEAVADDVVIPQPLANADSGVVPAAGTELIQPAAGPANPRVYAPGVPYYQPYVVEGNAPYTYDQYSRSFFPAGAANAQPMTMRQYMRQFPRVLRNQVGNAIRGPATGGYVPPAAGAAVPTNVAPPE